MGKKKPVLSIGIIFRDNIRSLERCLQALEPLRRAVPCELVMADTGSVDGSREVAEKYADILFDFTWVNDFSAARNAVMDRSSGQWYLTVDSDEYLDEDISEIAGYLNEPKQWRHGICAVVQRNWRDYEMEGDYRDFMAMRMVRLSPQMRYFGAIHESLPMPPGGVFGLPRTVLHHDGYVELNDGSEEGEAKRERNMALLKAELEKDPDNLLTLLQCMESSGPIEERLSYARLGLEAIGRKVRAWERIGPAIYRYAVNYAYMLDMPEQEEWAAQAEELFPDSIFTRLDVAYLSFMHAVKDKRPNTEIITRGEKYLTGLADYRAGNYNMQDILWSSLLTAAKYLENTVLIALARAYFQEKQGERAKKALSSIHGKVLDTYDIPKYLNLLMGLHSQFWLDMSGVLLRFWGEAGLAQSDSKQAKAKLAGFLKTGGKTFDKPYRAKESAMGHRHAYTIFLDLLGTSEFGAAAAVLESEDAGEISSLLSQVADWDFFPTPALAHALRCGAAFPPDSRTFYLEELDAIATRLLASEEDFLEELLSLPIHWKAPAQLNWHRALALAAVQIHDWEKTTVGMPLVRYFAAAEREFLSRCYVPLNQEMVCLLPPLHRLGWYLVQAVDAKDRGDKTGYIRLLKDGLHTCESGKPMIEFLLREFDQEQHRDAIPTGSDELMELAQQVKNILAQYSVDDPAVAALKQSEVYQQVAFLLEEPEGVVPS